MYKTHESSKAYVNQRNYFKGPQSFGHIPEDSSVVFEENGFISMQGGAIAWEDLRFPATSINPLGAVAAMTFDTDNIGFLASPTAIQTVAIIGQMPHGWEIGSEIHPHIHWQTTSANLGNVLWRLEYKWTSYQGVEDALWTSITALGAASGVSGSHLIAGFPAVSGAGKGISSILSMKVSRVGSDVADTYPDNALLKEFDIHYKLDTLGSRLEYSK